MKRYTFILFTFLLAAGSLSAQFPQKPGDPVDYSRIIRPHLPGSHPLTYTGYGGERPFTFTEAVKGVNALGAYQSGKKVTMDDIQKFNDWGDSKYIELAFNGELLRTRDLTDEDVENAIQFALRRMSWSRADVATANEWLGKIRNVDYSMEEFWEDMKAVMGVSGTLISVGTGGLKGLNPLDPGVNDLIFHVIGTGGDVAFALSSEQDARKYVQESLNTAQNAAETLGVSMAYEWIKGTVMDFVNFYDAMEKADARQKQITKNRVAETFDRKLEQFYTLVNSSLPQQRGEIWMIYVQGSAIEDFTFEDVLCRQKWTIDMHLKDGYDDAWKEADPKAYKDGYEGVYMGKLDAHLEFNLVNYDASFNPRTTDMVWTALSNSDIRFLGVQWKSAQSRLGGSFNYTGMKTVSSAHHILPVAVEIKRNNDSKRIVTSPHIIERDMLKRAVSDLPQKRSGSNFSTSHTYTYSVSGDGFHYDGSAGMTTKNDSTLVVKTHQDLQTPKGDNIIETFALALLRAMMFANAENEISSYYNFRRETYPIGTIEIDLQTNTEEEEGVIFY